MLSQRWKDWSRQERTRDPVGDARDRFVCWVAAWVELFRPFLDEIIPLLLHIVDQGLHLSFDGGEVFEPRAVCRPPVAVGFFDSLDAVLHVVHHRVRRSAIVDADALHFLVVVVEVVDELHDVVADEPEGLVG